MYLEEAGEATLFESTKSYSLGHIIKFIENYESMDGLGSSEIVSLISGEQVSSIEDMTDDHFKIYSVMKSLKELLSEDDIHSIFTAVDRIDKYHEDKRAKSEDT